LEFLRDPPRVACGSAARNEKERRNFILFEYDVGRFNFDERLFL
jgi:hypothetical protein